MNPYSIGAYQSAVEEVVLYEQRFPIAIRVTHPGGLQPKDRIPAAPCSGGR